MQEPDPTLCASTQPPDLRSASTADLLAWRDRIVAQARLRIDSGQVAEGVALLGQLALATTDVNTLQLTDPWLPAIAAGRRVVASFDPARVPSADEVVIVYGNYPHMFGNVVVNNPIKRHVADFRQFRHDAVEFDARWNPVERIFIINADDRPDRYDSVLRELAIARAPLDRVTRIRAIAGERELYGDAAGQIGCMSSHLVALKSAREQGLRNILVLEDDFCFTSDIEQHLADLGSFFARDYDYWVCLIATSKFGPIVPKDDLIAESLQACTNTAGHFLSAEGISRVIDVYENAVEQLKRTGEAGRWAPDRCWSVLQPSGKFFVFRRKWGFQNSSFSDIERRISRYLD
jgi:hypothetical protein